MGVFALIVNTSLRCLHGTLCLIAYTNEQGGPWVRLVLDLNCLYGFFVVVVVVYMCIVLFLSFFYR